MTINLPHESDSKIKIEETDFYKEMEVNRSGNLLEAARLKAGLSQKQLADAIGIRQTMVSLYNKTYLRFLRR